MMLAARRPTDHLRTTWSGVAETITAAALLLFGLLGAGIAVADEDSKAAAAAQAELDFFEARIRPVLVEHCYRCHSAGGEKIESGLRLDLREGLRRGGELGPAIVPGKPEESLLLSALRHESLQMPPDRKLPADIIADFERWIASGAADPREGDLPPAASVERDWVAARQFWAFQPPRASPPPRTSQPQWLSTCVDPFILAKLEQAGLAPNPPADRRTLLRRVTFDLTGLPPTAAEVQAFLADAAPDAYERVVDRLLASPEYGERWARLWLDVMRYAEDQAHIVGNDRSLCYPNAYLYRDWVIGAFNADLGYDEFLRRQLAADLIDPVHPDEHVALGFIGLGPKYYRRNSPEVMADEWEDRVDVVTRGVLGVTVACARCHDHKYDPFEMADYYALAGVFASTEMFNRPLSEAAELDDKGRVKHPEQAAHIVREDKPRDLPIYQRGDVTRPGAVTPRRFLKVLRPDGDETTWSDGSGRRELAEALVADSNPLTARVIVNRLWGAHFGRPLVGTPSNFGRLGELPTHPELLDTLAVEFMRHGWSLKWLTREIVLSAAYRQSSEIRPEALAVDPANRWLWRMNRRRLTVEQWRDAVLMVAGRLDRTLGGPSCEPQQPDVRRRTVYSRISRLELNPLLARFDFPDPNTHSDQRSETTTPLQKLLALNSPFMDTQAQALAARAQAGCEDDRARLKLLYETVLARAPLPAEQSLALEFLTGADDPDIAWTQLAQVLLAGNEFLYLD